MHIPDRTPWNRVFAVFFAGVATAFLIGKVPAALPALREELQLSLFQAGLVVSMFMLITALSGVMFGVAADRFGYRRSGISGLAVAGAAGVAGSFAEGPTLLLAARAFEGVGFVMVSVSLPPIIAKLATDRHRSKALGLWGAFVPAGSALILLIGGYAIGAIGWRGLWLAVSASYLVFAALLWWAADPVMRRIDAARKTEDRGRLITALRARGPVLLTLVFTFYSSLYLTVTAFVPLILVERAGWPLTAAASAGAVVMAVNIIGNVGAGFLLDHGIARVRLLHVATIAMAIGSTLLFLEAVPVVLRIVGGAVFAAFGGMIPGSLFAAVPRHAPSPRHVSTVNGMMFQGVSIGQFVGPAVTTWVVDAADSWTAALIYVLPATAACFVAATLLGRLERSDM